MNNIVVEKEQMTGRYFTQWRIDELESLLQSIVYCHDTGPEIPVENAKIWYDEVNDFHMLSYEAGGNKIKVRFYKVFSSTINGEDGWIGCPRSSKGEFAKYLRDLSRPKRESKILLMP